MKILLYALIAVYTSAEVVALMVGLHVLPYRNPSIAYPWLVGAILGALIEKSLSSGQRRSGLGFLMAHMYIISLLAGMTSRYADWLAILSAVMFVVLMARVVYLISRKPESVNSETPA